MLIPVGSDYRISGDSLQWTVEKRTVVEKEGKNKGKEFWKPESYHTTLEFAILSLAMRKVRTSPAQTVEEAVKDIQRIAKEFQAVLLEPLGLAGLHSLKVPAGTPPTPPAKAVNESCTKVRKAPVRRKK